ncbi:MAG: GGDEF domain-containing protein [Woeseiaceae bacterium]|nr:GGDEF domain-containing protein [Woeseiaceae bacterium]
MNVRMPFQGRSGERDVARAAPVTGKPGVQLTLEEFLPLMLCATGALGVLPFAVIRFMNQDWLIGLLDVVIVGGFAMLGLFVLRSGQVRIASVFITVLGIGGMLGTMYLKGPQQVYWAYPALIVAYYLLTPKEAVAATAVVLVALFPLLSARVDTFTLATVMISITMTAVFAYAFASLTRGQRNQLMNLATRDPLTGAGNRRALTQKMTEVIAAHERTASTASARSPSMSAISRTSMTNSGMAPATVFSSRSLRSCDSGFA